MIRHCSRRIPHNLSVTKMYFATEVNCDDFLIRRFHRSLPMQFNKRNTEQVLTKLYHTRYLHTIEKSAIKNPAMLKIIDDQEIQDFRSFFPNLVQQLTCSNPHTDIDEANDRFSKVLDYNIPHGKQLRPHLFIGIYKFLENEKLSEERMRQMHIMAWCIEMLVGYALMIDDVGDSTKIRRGKKTWHAIENVGINAINDAITIQMSVYNLLYKHFKEHKFYIEISNTFVDSNLKMVIGQSLDSTRLSLPEYTVRRYNDIAALKSGYLTFYLPIVLAMYLANRADLSLQNNCLDVFLRLGRFNQFQNDYMDCFGTHYSKKPAEDIQNGKCTWLLLKALEKCTQPQINILRQCYGKSDDESVAAVKNIYLDLNLQDEFEKEAENCLNDTKSLISQINNTEAKTLLTKILHVCLGYDSYFRKN